MLPPNNYRSFNFQLTIPTCVTLNGLVRPEASEIGGSSPGNGVYDEDNRQQQNQASEDECGSDANEIGDSSSEDSAASERNYVSVEDYQEEGGNHQSEHRHVATKRRKMQDGILLNDSNSSVDEYVDGNSLLRLSMRMCALALFYNCVH